MLLRAAPSVASLSRVAATIASPIVAVCSDWIDSCHTVWPEARFSVQPASIFTVKAPPNIGCCRLEIATVSR